jgi:CRP-like cAMP-binding protein
LVFDPESMSTLLDRVLTEILGPLPVSALAVLASSRVVSASSGEPLLRAGERWGSLYWVERGVLRLYYLDRRGASTNKNFYIDGSLLWPLTPTLAGQPVNFWIEAITPSRIWAVPCPAWQTACAGWPSWQALERRTLAALLDEKMRREQQFLQLSATSRYQDLCARRPEWMSRIPLRHLASYIGVTDVALSRIRGRLNPG